MLSWVLWTLGNINLSALPADLQVSPITLNVKNYRHLHSQHNMPPSQEKAGCDNLSIRVFRCIYCRSTTDFRHRKDCNCHSHLLDLTILLYKDHCTDPNYRLCQLTYHFHGVPQPNCLHRKEWGVPQKDESGGVNWGSCHRDDIPPTEVAH